VTSDRLSISIPQSAGESSPDIYEKVLEVIQFSPDTKVLDLGCGEGFFIQKMMSKGVPAKNITGCDMDRFGSNEDTFNYVKTNLEQPLPLPDQIFQLVTALEVIEHLENPRALIREISRVLTPGGTAVISTPNNESFTSLLSLAVRGYPSAFADANYPAHITPILFVDLRRMLLEANLTDIQTHWSKRGRIPGTPFHWQSIGLGTGRRISDNLIVTARKL
jgi:2-polyprenyl-3-methyl-5-hydroxy-6-metoxy-1,4-benzoquinol methylase